MFLHVRIYTHSLYAPAKAEFLPRGFRNINLIYTVQFLVKRVPSAEPPSAHLTRHTNVFKKLYANGMVESSYYERSTAGDCGNMDKIALLLIRDFKFEF